MVLASTVDEWVKNSRSNLPISLNMAEIPKKSKMKFKAAKVLKFVLNFLQRRPKKKYGDKEKLCVRSYIQDSLSNSSEVYESHPLPTSYPTDSITSHDQINKGLSMSWSYLVHDSFNEDVTTIEVCDVDTDMDESGEIFYNESYFEDDYWQDYHGYDVTARSPVVCGNQTPKSFNQRLFEPERTPCGEFKRNGRAEMPRKLHASLPNLNVENDHLSNTLPIEDGEDISDVSEVFKNYNQLVLNYPPLSLNIAFDNLLDETTMCEGTLYSVNQLPLSFTEEMCAEQFVEREHNDQLMKNADYSSLNLMAEWHPDSLKNESFTGSYNQLNFNITEKCETAEMCLNNLEKSSSSRVSDSSVPASVTDDFLEDDVFGFDHCTLDLCDPSLPKGIQVSSLSESSSTDRSLKHQSLESGYKSVNSASQTSVTSLSALEPISEMAVNGLNTEKPIEICMLDLPAETGVKAYVKSHAVRVDDKTFTVSLNSLQKQNQTNIIPSTSSPMQIKNTSLQTDKTLTPISYFLSPIRQNPEMPKIRRCTISEGSTKKISHERQRLLFEGISPLPPRFNRDRYKFDLRNELAMSSLSGDNLTKAADFIVNRIQIKEELKADINKVELIEYLRAFYMAEITKLSNKNIQTISDYKRITKEACDIFTSARLTQENCLCEILIAILGNRYNIVSACEDFILDNIHVINSQEFLQAPPELILMLLANYHKAVLDSNGYPLSFKGSELHIKLAVGKYLEEQRIQNIEKYFRVKRMILYAINQIAEFQVDRTNVSQDCQQGIKSQSSEQFATTSNKPYPRIPRKSVSDMKTWFDSLGEQKIKSSFRKLAVKSHSTMENTKGLPVKSQDDLDSPAKLKIILSYPPASKATSRIPRIIPVITQSSFKSTGGTCTDIKKGPTKAMGAEIKLPANSAHSDNKGVFSYCDSGVHTVTTAHRNVHLFRSETFSGFTVSLQGSSLGKSVSSLNLQHQKGANCEMWRRMGPVISTAV